MSVLELVKPPDLNQARVNKCLIALVNRKIVTKENGTVCSPSSFPFLYSDVRVSGSCTISLARAPWLKCDAMVYPIEVSYTTVVAISICVDTPHHTIVIKKSSTLIKREITYTTQNSWLLVGGCYRGQPCERTVTNKTECHISQATPR